MSFNIGLCFDLRSTYLAEGYSEEECAEFDQEETIVALETALQRLGHRTERIGHARHLAAALVAGRRWHLVFNIAEGLHGPGREAQVPTLLDLYRIPYTFSDPLVMCLTLHKGMCKAVLRDAGVPTAASLVVQKGDSPPQPAFPGPYFVKPVAEGTGKGVSAESIVAGIESLPRVCGHLIAQFQQPVLIEPFLPGREFTTGIIGTGAEAEVLGTMEVLLNVQAEQGVYSYNNKENWQSRVQYRLIRPEEDAVVAEAEAVAFAAWRVLGCRDGGRVDLRCSAAGQPLFMEVNPLAGLHPSHSDLPILCGLAGISYQDLISRIVASALTRSV
ncbi:MAG: D-alanine--D-alanine ligase [Desulfobulbaceae bacterium]|nr:D-alanine--D-alanine ligase [Desulfobulbaceae bacterium]